MFPLTSEFPSLDLIHKNMYSLEGTLSLLCFVKVIVSGLYYFALLMTDCREVDTVSFYISFTCFYPCPCLKIWVDADDFMIHLFYFGKHFVTSSINKDWFFSNFTLIKVFVACALLRHLASDQPLHLHNRLSVSPSCLINTHTSF